MGFDTILMPFPQDRTGDDYIGVVASACHGRKLSLYLDLAIDRPPMEGVEEAGVEWVHLVDRSREAAIDPRHMSADAEPVAEIRFEIAAVARAATDWWAERMAAWIDLGVDGFCFRNSHKVSSTVWRELMELAHDADPACCFLAWTPGLTRDQQKALRGCGFNGVFTSARWWDFRSDWLLDDIASLRSIAPAIAFPEAPGPRRATPEFDGVETAKAAYRRALWLAAFTGDGLLIPSGFEHGGAALDEKPLFDLSAEIGEINGWAAERAADGGALSNVGTPGGDVVALMRADATSEGASLYLANAHLDRFSEIDVGTVLMRLGSFGNFTPLGGDAPMATEEPLRLAPGETRILTGTKSKPIIVASRSRKSFDAAVSAPRIAIENIQPSVDGGRFPVKRIVGERVRIEADVFADGHDELAVRLLWRTGDARNWTYAPMTLAGNDRWQADLSLERLGVYQFTIEAWWDDFATLLVRLGKKHAARKPLENEFADASRQLAAAHAAADTAQRVIIEDALARLDAAESDDNRVAVLAAPKLAAAMAVAAPRHFTHRYPATFGIWAERREAQFASWYELFPRSQSPDPQRPGTFDDVVARLPAIRDMGFDVLYFPPIHPIGRTNRKGRNNALTAEPGEPGSPYAIGSHDGGHTDIHPELGTLADFRHLRDAAMRHGLELALDFAIQCSPDHPWLKEHPDWFKWQPDGSLRYAENPPKTYEDITNVEFYAPEPIPELWLALQSIVLFWVGEGVKIFRVDNPHTKPLPFWEWLIADVRSRHPDVIFLAEAFTAPKRMYRLAKLGFSQSYTYFTWRHGKAEFADYLTHLSQDEVREFFRPNFFVNTPDINPPFLQNSGRAGHLIRAALATLTSGVWGMYSGFELCEATPVPGREEYLNSEKYEVRHWDWERPGNIIAEIAALNRIRKANPALQSHLGIKFHTAYNDQILYFARETPSRDNVVLVAINLDPFHVQEADIELPLWEWGLGDDAALAVEDLVHETKFTLYGKNQHLRLDPADLPYAVWRVKPAGGN
ncbi:MAG TPA: alpha-1,4-glucan--maltose-1-phosphate maltosyltransferase [Parvibaculum sp.]